MRRIAATGRRVSTGAYYTYVTETETARSGKAACITYLAEGGEGLQRRATGENDVRVKVGAEISTLNFQLL